MVKQKFIDRNNQLIFVTDNLSNKPIKKIKEKKLIRFRGVRYRKIIY